MVEGKLAELDREPQNVHVVRGATPLDAFSLLDADGSFLTVKAEEEAPDEERQESSDAESEGSENEL